MYYKCIGAINKTMQNLLTPHFPELALFAINIVDLYSMSSLCCSDLNIILI